MPSPAFEYRKDRLYSISEFEELNHQLKIHELVVEDTPVNHFELDAKGRLIPMPQVPITKEAAVAEIAGQVRSWNIQTRQNGVVTSSQGGFKFGGSLRAPDIAFTPKETYRNLTDEQISSFQGPAFFPSFVVEVDNLKGDTEAILTAKFKETYFPAGVKLGWLIDPVNRKFYSFWREKDGVVCRHNHDWVGKDGKTAVVSGRDVLPGFQLELWMLDEASSRDDSDSESESEVSEIACPMCNETFIEHYNFLRHYEYDHMRKRRPTH